MPRLDKHSVSIFTHSLPCWQGLCTEAATLYQRTLSIEEETLGLDHLDVATTLMNLAGSLQSQVNAPFVNSVYYAGLKGSDLIWGSSSVGYLRRARLPESELQLFLIHALRQF